jgi:hypothetical protein
MDIINDATIHLNPGQTPILAMDQPLFAIAKLIQWNFPQQYGEDKYVIMFGGLHIEMMAFKMAGQWMEDSGLTQALECAEIATEGTADSFTNKKSLTSYKNMACSSGNSCSSAYTPAERLRHL